MRNSRPWERESSPARPVGASITATDAQNNFGQVLSRARSEGRVFITRYDRPEAVLLSIEEYESLLGRDEIDLHALEREFDEMLAQMQRPEQRRSIDRLFSMGPEELGGAAARGSSNER
jgi:prevent-host-death family protein